MYQPAKAATDEYAVMLDARDALEMGEAAAAVEVSAYADSWKVAGGPIRAPKAPVAAE
jgi:homogentisate 1,2-dioxygenase